LALQGGHDDCDDGDGRNHRQDPRDRSDVAIETEFAEQPDRRAASPYLLRAEQDPDRDGQVERCPGLAQVRVEERSNSRRRGASEVSRQAAALQAGQRAVARGERPLYRAGRAEDRSWTIEGCPWQSVTASDRRGALDGTRTAVAEWLEVGEDAIEVEAMG
jgi:hypothetical protein